MGVLVGDVDYQHRLRADFRRRRVHPAVETLVWSHVIGKPTERVQLSADVTMNQKLEEERELFSRLSIEQMEQIAAESQALVDRVMAMVRANATALPPDAVASRRASVEDGESSDAPNPRFTGTDPDGYGKEAAPLDPDPGKPGSTDMRGGVSPSRALRVADVGADEASEQLAAPSNSDQRDAAGPRAAHRDTH